MTAAADFIDAALQYESTWQRAEADRDRVGGGLTFYGASIGAVRGTVRAVGLKFPGLDHDEVTALASELWEGAVFERRLAAIVLLQMHVRSLIVTDLTRLEGFVRSAGASELVDPIVADVIVPLVASLDGREASRAAAVVDRWRTSKDEWLRRAAASLRRQS